MSRSSAGSSTTPHRTDSRPGRASAIAHRQRRCDRRSSARRPYRRIATGRMPALSARRTSARPIAGSRRDWKKACVPHAPSISMRSQRAPKPPVPARGSPRSSERSLHGSHAPWARRSRGGRSRSRRPAHLGTSTPSRSSRRETTREDSGSSPGSARQSWSPGAGRARRAMPRPEARSSCGGARSAPRARRPRCALGVRRATRVSCRASRFADQIDRREGPHRRGADRLVECPLQRCGDRANSDAASRRSWAAAMVAARSASREDGFE